MISSNIKSEFVNVVNKEGKGLTKMKLVDAIALANETEEDVIVLNTKSEIPVVKIDDYNKIIYEKKKKDKENKKKARLNYQAVKEIKLRDSIAEHDLEVKAKNIDRLLNEGSKVIIIIEYKGRTIRLINKGPEKLKALETKLKTKYKIDREPRIEGNRVSMILSSLTKGGK